MEEEVQADAAEGSKDEDAGARASSRLSPRRPALMWSHIPGFPWWPSVAISETTVPADQQPQVQRAKLQGMQLMYTLGDNMYYWARSSQLQAWQGPEHDEFIKAGQRGQGKSGAPFRQALFEGESEWSRQDQAKK